MKSSKSKMQHENIFTIFQDATQTAFEFLLTDLDFKLDSITVDDSIAWLPLIACRVKYRNETTEIAVMYDWYEDSRGTPQVSFGRLNANENGSLEVVEGYNLDLLISERCPDKSLKTYPEDPVDRIKQTVNDYALILAECAQPELAGDFTIFPRLRKTLANAMKGAVFLDTRLPE